MKKLSTIIVLILFFISSSTVFSQILNKTDFKPLVKNGRILLAPEVVTEQLTGVLSQYWIPNEWHDGGRFLYEYNDAGSITAMYMDSLHNSEWKTIMSMEVEYDGSNRPITDIIRMYEIDGTEILSTKNVTSYDGDKTDETIQYSWGEDDSDWVLSMKQVYEYTSNLVSKISDYSWNEFTSDWEPYEENIMTYDNQGREIEGLRTTWDSQESIFVNSDLTTTEYYKDLLVSRMESKGWDAETSSWSSDNYDLTVNKYNSNDKVIESVFTYSMGFAGFAFVLKDSTIFEYDASNYLIVETDYSWQDMVGYAAFTKVEYNNDANGNVLDEIHFSYSGLETWVPYQKIIYTYDGAVAVESEEQLPTEFVLEQNYPNPFNPTTTFSYSISETNNVNLAVYDILGNYILTLTNETQARGNYKVKFDATNLSSGSYIYVLKTGNNAIAKKCLLIK